MAWAEFTHKLIQIDSSVKMKESKWIASCDNCQCERIISYTQAWNIQTGKYQNHCSKCKDRNPNSNKNMFKAGHSSWNKGKFKEKSHRWLGNRSEKDLLTSRKEYRELRLKCFERDNFSCQVCSKSGVYLEMDHIKEWCNYPELRFEMSNLRTLCQFCHRMTDNYGPKARKRAL